MHRIRIIPVALAGSALIALGASCAALQQANQATTQAAAVAQQAGATIAADAPLGSPLSDIALVITGVSTGILALERIVSAVSASLKSSSGSTGSSSTTSNAPAASTAAAALAKSKLPVAS